MTTPGIRERMEDMNVVDPGEAWSGARILTARRPRVLQKTIPINLRSSSSSGISVKSNGTIGATATTAS